MAEPILSDVPKAVGNEALAWRLQNMEACESLDELTEWMDGLVGEWTQRDSKVFSVAAGGLSLLQRVDEGATVPATLFEVIQDLMEDNCRGELLEAGIRRFRELAASTKQGTT